MTDIPSKVDAARFVRPLPAKPNLDKQKKLAKALMRDYCRGSKSAAAKVDALHPKPPAPGDFALSDAQLVIAHGYGFASWPKLKRKIESLTRTPVDLFVDAVRAGDVETVQRLIDKHPKVAAKVNAPLFDFGRRAVHAARENLAMLDLLLARGADINAKSDWEHGGFGILEEARPEEADELISRGAEIDVCAAAHLGRLDVLRSLLAADPSLVNAKGGDGKRPLHYATTIEIAEYLLDHGAEIDALDDDHQSTPAQYMVKGRPGICRLLITRGAKTDLLMAVALGDIDLVRRHLVENPDSIRMAVNQNWFPMIDTDKNGGHIYQWVLGFYLSAFEIAAKFERREVLDHLRQSATPAELLVDALRSGDLAAADALLADNPGLVRDADDRTLRAVSDAGRHNDTATMRAMLERGFPVTAKSQHEAMPLHWAAFHGNPEMMRLVLDYDPPLVVKDRDFGGDAMGWALHGAHGSWDGTSSSQHAECVQMLLDAGLHCPQEVFPTGHDAVDRVLRAHFFGNAAE